MSLTNPSIPHPPPPPPPPPHPTDPPTINVLVILVPTLPYMIFDLAELQLRRSGRLFANSVVVHQNYSYLWITHSSWLCLLHPRPWQSVRSPLLPCILFFPLLVPREIQIGSYFAVWLEFEVQPLGLSLSLFVTLLRCLLVRFLFSRNVRRVSYSYSFRCFIGKDTFVDLACVSALSEGLSH